MPLTFKPTMVESKTIREALRQIEAADLWEEIAIRSTGPFGHAMLSPALAKICRLVTWRQNRWIAKSWFRNVTIIMWLTAPFDYMAAPHALNAILLGHGLLTTLAYLFARRAWKDVHSETCQGLATCLYTLIIMLATTMTGAQIGGGDFERLLNIAFLGMATSLTLLPLQLRWTALTAGLLNLAYLVSQSLNPAIDEVRALVYTVYFGFLTATMVYSRMHMNRRQVRATLARLSEARYRHMLVEAYDRLRDMALTDSLTGLYNRQAITDAFTRLIGEEANDGPLSLAMIDIDHFKALNDHQGHAAGDRALQAMGALLQELASTHGALCGRIGGEEFLILMPDTPQDTACLCVATLMAALTERRIPNPGSSVADHVTISAGIVTTRASGERGYRLEDLMRAADLALYDAKHAGRNQIATATPPPLSILV